MRLFLTNKLLKNLLGDPDQLASLCLVLLILYAMLSTPASLTSVFGVLPPLRLRDAVALNLESSVGNLGTVNMVSIQAAPTQTSLARFIFGTRRPVRLAAFQGHSVLQLQRSVDSMVQSLRPVFLPIALKYAVK